MKIRKWYIVNGGHVRTGYNSFKDIETLYTEAEFQEYKRENKIAPFIFEFVELAQIKESINHVLKLLEKSDPSPDHACKHCKPNGEALVSGFICARHMLKELIGDIS